MQIICFCQAIMPERLGVVTRALQAFEKSHLERLLFGFSTDCGKQTLQLTTMSQIADPVVKAKHELTILGEFLWVWVFVDAIDGGNSAFLELPGDRFVRCQHEFFDELVRFVILHALQSYWVTLFIDPDFYFRKIEI